MTESTRPPAKRRGLDREQITNAAVELLDEVGLAALSTRRLAAKLGVQSPTLYWHVRNKTELMDLVAEAICADAFQIDESQPWRDQLASGLRQFRALLLTHRDAATLLRERPPVGPRRLEQIDTTVRILLRAGFSEDEAAGISRVLSAHVLASVEDYPPRPTDDSGGGPPSAMLDALADFESLRRVGPSFARLDGAEVFELGIQILLDGLSRRRSTS
ncbi:TetR/AcrR family transcriptional regulator C-terminal domain-containing protein [Spiractinospora alimapuensis]|uniref:TetR/AcrR family transcriptional regulator C-terminal domain-containing protein n=1 Tax=Spiractinospora alimapuensis TaxID=2820884 RepID=UPI001F181F48|nr:TetR/AcrR family transcriptional regulator C-terminal domain-containing protein [Spiractinospora alimapuensis]QVQ50754.1 TetR/AcrR family transcriptional regulator C-terminal domain-containing protein [Spiractinospora alimapuensis]